MQDPAHHRCHQVFGAALTRATTAVNSEWGVDDVILDEYMYRLQGRTSSVADNQDGQLNPYELNAAVGEVAKSAVQSVFQAADADRNSMLSMDEYDKALAEPAHAVFRVLDANADQQLSLEELQRAEQIIADQIQRLRVPEASNSISNQVRNRRNGGYRSGPTANQPAPVPPAPSPR